MASNYHGTFCEQCESNGNIDREMITLRRRVYSQLSLTRKLRKEDDTLDLTTMARLRASMHLELEGINTTLAMTRADQSKHMKEEVQ